MASIFWLSIYGVHIGAIWQIRSSCLCAAAMQSCVKLFLPLVVFVDDYCCWGVLQRTRNSSGDVIANGNFLRRRRTSYRVLSDALTTANDRQVMLIALLNLSSVFDCVDHEMLPRRL